MTGIDPLGFAQNYGCEVDPEFPGNGDWGVPTHSFWVDGPRQEPFRSAWGAPLVLRIQRADGTSWVGSVESGGIGGITGVFGCPDPDAICLVLGGQAFLVDTRCPARYRSLPSGVTEVRRSPALELLLLATPVDLTAIGKDGLSWTTARLCLDELRLLSASSEGIVCAGSFLDRDEQLVVSPQDGQLLAGPVCPY